MGLSWCCACGTPVPEPGWASDAPVDVSFEPSAAPDQVANVVHVHLSSLTLSSDAVSLFEGKLSSYYLGRLRHGELPSPLASRRVPIASWRAGTELVLAPLRPLGTGPHSLVSVDGLIAEFTVADVRPVLDRVWPPGGSAGNPRFAVYCRPEASTVEVPNSGSVLFQPGATSVELEPGVDDAALFEDRCSHFQSELPLTPGAIWVPPPELGDWALSPVVFSSAQFEAATPLECQSGEVAFGPGCAIVADDRLSLRTPPLPVLWIVHTAHGALLEVSTPGRSLTIDGLVPGGRERLWGSTRDLSGETQAFELELQMTGARARPILNEVLADPLGPEPKSEWVELLNDGTLAADLAQYSLQDGGGRTPLPHAWLAPQEYALLVREDFAPNSSDPPPVAGARLIRLPSLGKSGLSNAGERLALLDGAGAELSVLPASVGKAGQSLARRTPGSEDGDPRSFRFGTPTPGFANDAQSGAP